MGQVVKFKRKDTETPEELLDRVKEINPTEVLILTFEDGHLFIRASGGMTRETCNWMIDQAKIEILDL